MITRALTDTERTARELYRTHCPRDIYGAAIWQWCELDEPVRNQWRTRAREMRLKR